MIAAVLAEALWKAARDHFTRGGSPIVLVYAAVGAAALVVVLLIVQRIQSRTVRRRSTFNPQKLFANLVGQSGLPVMQRETLRQMADDLRLTHPAVMLLGPEIFEAHARRWVSATTQSDPDSVPGVLPEAMVDLGQAIFGPLLDPTAERATPNSESGRQIDDQRPLAVGSVQAAGDGSDPID